MYRQNPVGFHTALTHEVHDKIIEGVGKVFRPRLVAKYAGISWDNLRNWLKRGAKDVKCENNTIFAQLFIDYGKAEAAFASEMSERIKKCPENYRALTWLLERGLPEEFGTDAAEREFMERLEAMEAKLSAGGAKANESNE